jgi:hypothetical protein
MNRRDAYGLGAALILALSTGAASAQVQVRQSAFGSFDAGDTCYQWSGGHGSAGAFSKCQPVLNVAVLTPTPQPAPTPMAIAPVCPPQITVMPEPKPKPRLFHKPKPKVQC